MSDISLTITGTKRLLTEGKYCDANIVVTADMSDYYTRTEVDNLISEQPTEDWVFTLEDGSTVTKTVVVK